MSDFQPKIIADIFDERDFEYAQVYAIELKKHGAEIPAPKIEVLDTPELRMFHEKIWKIAKKEFLPMQNGDVEITYADVQSLIEYTGYEPKTSIHVGISNFVKWYRSYYKI